MNNYLLALIVLLAFCAIFFFWQWQRLRREAARRRQSILDVLEQARDQYEVMGLKFLGPQRGATQEQQAVPKSQPEPGADAVEASAASLTSLAAASPEPGTSPHDQDAPEPGAKPSAENTPVAPAAQNQPQSQAQAVGQKPGAKRKSRAGFPALLQEIDEQSLLLDVADFVPRESEGQELEVYFKVETDSGPVFYVFRSRLLKIEPDYEHSRLSVSMPESLRVERKRRFLRVNAPTGSVRVIGIWPMRPGTSLPRATSEISAPLTHYRPGMTREPVQVEDISAGGLSLRLDSKEALGADTVRGAHLLCLLVHLRESSARPVAFWCTGEIMNAREAAGARPARVIGLEFTNWAVLEEGSSEIHWVHSSPTRGAKPILQWVAEIERKRRRKSA